MSCAKTAEPIVMLFGIWTSGGPKDACVRWNPDPHTKCQFLGERSCPSYLRSVCSNCLPCRISNFGSSEYLISMQAITRYGRTV